MRRRSYFQHPPLRRMPRRAGPPASHVARHCLAVLVIALFGLVCMKADSGSLSKLLPILVPPLTLVLHHYFGRRGS